MPHGRHHYRLYLPERMPDTLAPLSLETIRHRSFRAESAGEGPDLTRPIDSSRWFVCPTLTPLYYAPIYRELNGDQQRRYNQLTGICFNELIAFFEESFAAAVLQAVADAQGCDDDQELVNCLQGFLREEQEHIVYWRRLNRLTEPAWYADVDARIIRFSPAVRRCLEFLTARPHWFPVMFWSMLALEERSLDISRRCLQMSQDAIEPTYRSVYRHHLRDEARHVQLDWHLIERFYSGLPLRWRWLNARMLATLVGRFFLPPTRSALRVVRQLASEEPDTARLLPEMTRQLRQVGNDACYQEMMYSRRTTPLTFALFDRFPEMCVMQRVLKSYVPSAAAGVST